MRLRDPTGYWIETAFDVAAVVAKPIVRGQLAALGREQEMKDFFPDLAVNEGSRRGVEEEGEGGAGSGG